MLIQTTLMKLADLSQLSPSTFHNLDVAFSSLCVWFSIWTQRVLWPAGKRLQVKVFPVVASSSVVNSSARLKDLDTVFSSSSCGASCSPTPNALLDMEYDTNIGTTSCPCSKKYLASDTKQSKFMRRSWETVISDCCGSFDSRVPILAPNSTKLGLSPKSPSS